MHSLIREVDSTEPLETLGGYLLLERFAAGGMAEVHLAHPLHSRFLPPIVAIKRLRQEAREQAEFRRMFADEARVVSRLRHRNIVRAFEYGAEGDTCYIAMELVRGLSVYEILRDLSDRGEILPLPLALWIAEQVCSGLTHAHGLRTDDGQPARLVHRDITPHNLMLSFSGDVKIVDFGIAKSSMRQTRTATGYLKGKVGYVAPEQANSPKSVDHRADIYALGVCLWEWVAGRRMHDPERTPLDVLRVVRDGRCPSLDELRPDLPEPLRAIVRKATAYDPADRYQSAASMGAALCEFRSRYGYATQEALRQWIAEKFGYELRAQEEHLRELLDMVLTDPLVREESDSLELDPDTLVYFSVEVEDLDDDDDTWSLLSASDLEVISPASGEPMSSTSRELERSGSTFPSITPAESLPQYNEHTRSLRSKRASRPRRATRRRDEGPGFVRRWAPRALAAVIGAVAGIVGGFGIWHALTARPGIPARVPVTTGSLRVDSHEMIEGLVFVDGEPVGTVPLEMDGLSAGEHEVRVRRLRHPDYVSNVNIAVGATSTLSIAYPETLPDEAPSRLRSRLAVERADVPERAAVPKPAAVPEPAAVGGRPAARGRPAALRSAPPRVTAAGPRSARELISTEPRSVPHSSTPLGDDAGSGGSGAGPAEPGAAEEPSQETPRGTPRERAPPIVRHSDPEVG